MQNWSKILQNFWSNSSVFTLEKQPKNLNFQRLFTSSRCFSVYFRYNVGTYFQKRCSWTRYIDAKSIKNILDFLVVLLRFCFSKTTWKFKFSGFLISKRLFDGCFLWNEYTYFQNIYSWTRYCDAKLIKNISNFLVALLCFWFRKTT